MSYDVCGIPTNVHFSQIQLANAHSGMARMIYAGPLAKKTNK
jgi:hypothetical protein